jgi:hypothetical protein
MKKTKSLPKLKSEAWDLYAKLIKLKRAENGYVKCFTCGSVLSLNTSNCQAGHYLSRGAYPGLMFHHDNVRPQCYRCNCHLHGNIVEFRERLICEIGLESVERMEASRHISVKWSRSELGLMIELYKAEIKDYL